MTTDLVQKRALDTAALRRLLPAYGVYVALALLVLFNIVFTDNFLAWNNLRIQLVQVTPVVIVALGMALVIGTEGIDLSVGSVMALGAALIPLYLGYGMVPAILLALFGGLLVGLINGSLVAFVGLQPIVATLALLVAGRGVALVLSSGRYKDIKDKDFLAIGTDAFLGVPYTVWIAGLLAAVVGFVIRKTVFGRRLLAIGDNRPAAQLAGVPVRRVLITVYIIAAVLAAVAGIIQVSRIGSADASRIGLLIELSAITAVVVGGTPLTGGRIRVLGTVAGAFLMQLLTATMIANNLKDSTAQMVQAVIILVAVYTGTRTEDPMTLLADAKVEKAEAASLRTERIVELVQRQGALAVLGIVLVVGLVSFDTFRSADNAGTILISAAPAALIALGMTFVIITGGIDLSVGSLYVLGGVLAAWASQYGLVAAFVAPLVVCGLFGLVQGLVIAYARLAPFIVTLAGLLGARGLMLALSQEGRNTYLVQADAFKHFGTGELLGVGYPVYLVVALFAAGMVVLYRTRFGQSVYAVGGSQDAARLMGVRIRDTQIRVYVLSGLLAGLAGAINAARLGSGVTVLGTGMELDAIAAVVIGGTLLTGGAGTLGGTIAGVLLLQVIQNLINQIGTVTSAWQTVISGVFIALVVVAQTYLAKLRRVASG